MYAYRELVFKVLDFISPLFDIVEYSSHILIGLMVFAGQVIFFVIIRVIISIL